jgi:hypothetical protein
MIYLYQYKPEHYIEIIVFARDNYFINYLLGSQVESIFAIQTLTAHAVTHKPAHLDLIT